MDEGEDMRDRRREREDWRIGREESQERSRIMERKVTRQMERNIHGEHEEEDEYMLYLTVRNEIAIYFKHILVDITLKDEMIIAVLLRILLELQYDNLRLYQNILRFLHVQVIEASSQRVSSNGSASALASKSWYSLINSNPVKQRLQPRYYSSSRSPNLPILPFHIRHDRLELVG